MKHATRSCDRSRFTPTRSVLIACLIAVIASGCSGQSPTVGDSGVTFPAHHTSLATATPVDEADCPSSVGTSIEAQLTTPDGVDRRYLLMVPEGITATNPVPVVIDFHGAGSSALQQARVSDFESLGRSEQFVVITPDARDGRWSSEDTSFVERMIEEVGDLACVDGTRVFAAGMSNGGFFASRLACNLANRLIAIGTVTGISYPSPCDQDRPVAIIHFHGLDDSIVQFEPIPRAIDQWARALGCAQADSEQVTPSIALLTHSGCEADTTVQFYQIENAGHTWPGSDETKRFEDALGVTNDEIDATRLIWEFFTTAEGDAPARG